MIVRVRPAVPGEFPAVARLTVAAYEADGQEPAATGYDAVLSDVGSRAESGEVLVAVDGDDRVLGAVTFVRSGSAYAQLCGPGEAEFRMLAVDPGAQRRGVATALVRACLAHAAELHCESVIICSRDVAVAAHRLYERMGFVRVPERDFSPVPGVRLLALSRSVEQLQRHF